MNIEKQKWGSYDDKDEQNNNISDEEIYNVIQPTLTAPVKLSSLPELKRIVEDDGQFNRNCLRESLVGFKDGVPGIFSGYAAEKVRSSIKKRQPFYRSGCENYTVVNLNETQDDDELISPGSSSVHDEERRSISNVIIKTADGSPLVETGTRFYNPKTEKTYRSATSFLLSSEEGNESASSYGSDQEETSEETAHLLALDDDEIYEAIGTPRSSLSEDIEPEYTNIDYGKVKKTREKLPRLPPRNSIIYYSEDDKETYFEVELKEQRKPVKLPPLKNSSNECEMKRYQLINCLLESEFAYMTSLRRIVKEYEDPLLEREIVNRENVHSMFKDVHEIMQCHQLFGMALSYRANEWNTKEIIGDVIHASFSKSMVFKAYCNFVSRFSSTMESIKETCKHVPAFLDFLKNKEYDPGHSKQTLYLLMCKPLEYIPNLVLLTETLLYETPFPHEDRLPLQMALTHLECLCENVANERTDTMMKEKVKYLDAQCVGLQKELASRARYLIRCDDMLLCKTENGKVEKTKLHTIFLLNDVVVCARKMNKRKQMQLMTNKRYKVKWCFPVSDVQVVDVASGIYINTETTKLSVKQVFSGHHLSKYVEDLLHDLTVVGDIMGKVSSLRLSHTFIEPNQVNEWYKELHQRLDGAMEMANMNWIEMSIPSLSGKGGERHQVLFNVSSPKTKLEWKMDFENINLLLTGDNNPGWYMQEENVYERETVCLRRALPLVSGIQPLFMVNPETSVQCILDVTPTSSYSKSLLWIFSCNDQLTVITLMEMNVSSVPHVLHSYVACRERVCCVELVTRYNEAETEKCPFVWIGTMSGRLLIYDALDINARLPLVSATLDDSIVSMKFTESNGVFVGLANGSLLRFDVEMGQGASWNISNPTMVSLSLFPIMSITESCDRLWCAVMSVIYIVDKDTMYTQEQLTTTDDRKKTIKQLVSYGIGVWVAMRKSSILLLYHSETKQQLQTINVTTPITRMRNEIAGPIQNFCLENIYVTTVLAKEGLLWVGVDLGFIVTFPIPKLGGIPTVSGKACVSFHGHGDSVRHIHAFCLQRSFQNNVDENNVEGNDKDECDGTNISVRSTDVSRGATKRKWGKTYSELGNFTLEAENEALDETETEPTYFVLEPESEPVTETSSVSETDEDEGNNAGKGIKNKELNNDTDVIERQSDVKSVDIPNVIPDGGHDPTTKDSEDTLCTHDFVLIDDVSIKLSLDGNSEFTNTTSLDESSGFTNTTSLDGNVVFTNTSLNGNGGVTNTIECFSGSKENECSKENTDAIDMGGLSRNELSCITSSSKVDGKDESDCTLTTNCDVSIAKGNSITERENIEKKEVLNNVEEEVGEESQTDGPEKAEIPLTFAAPRHRRKQSGIKSVINPSVIPDCGDDRAINPNSNKSLTKETDLPVSIFVGGESFSEYDVRSGTENRRVVPHDDKCPEALDVVPHENKSSETFDIVSESHQTVDIVSESHHYEAPLKILDDVFYATLGNEKEQDITQSVKVSQPGSAVGHGDIGKYSLSVRDKLQNNSPRFTSLRETQKLKCSEAAALQEVNRRDETKTWYVASIGRGHVDLRKGSRYNEETEELNLLKSSSFEGREPILMLWKLNVGKSIFFLE